MLLAIDIGNTNTGFGIFEGDKLVRQWKISTVRERTADELGVLVCGMLALTDFEISKISAVIASCVVTELKLSFERMSEKYLGRAIIFIDATFDLDLKIKYKPPTSVGADRIAAAAAVVYKYGKPCIVCDFGTAATIDAVNSNGEYLGGIIAPGITLLADALFQNTSKLPKVEIGKPAGVIGNSTVRSIQAGVFFGYVGLVDGIIKRMFDELGEKTKTVATGGFAKLIAADSETIEIVDETLVLEGLRIIYERAARIELN